MLTKATNFTQIVDNLRKADGEEHKMASIKKGLAAAFALLGVLTAGSSHAAELRKVAINFGLTYVPVGNGPVFSVPQAMGFWKDEGLDVEVQLANGSIGGVPPAMTLINKGAQIITAASINSRNIYYPVALETSAIKTVADMKG